MDLTLVLLRIVHIFAGVLWAGSAVFFLFLVSPTAKAIGPAGQQFMRYFVVRKRYPQYMGVVASLTMLSGIFLFATVSGGFQIAWLKTASGMTLAFGSVMGMLTAPVAIKGIQPRTERLAALGESIAAAGGPPAPAQLAEIEQLDRELGVYERLDFAMVTISVLTMAVARYLAF